ncbi:MAG: apolipoprotein N-acyltransferase [Rhodoferax sp.]|nr:apolipoprotein N-acyltransferase [Rhodoferax sp.]
MRQPEVLARRPGRWGAQWPGRATGLALLAGALQAVSLAWPWGTPAFLAALGVVQGQAVWWLQLLALSLWVGLLRQSAHPAAAAWLGSCFGTAWLALTFGWLFISMHTYGGLNPLLALLAVLALAAALAVYTAAASWCFKALALTNQALAALYFAALWLLAELARGLLLTGFGWGGVGYAQVDGPMAGVLPWVGVYGLGALTAWLAAMLAGLVGWGLPLHQRGQWVRQLLLMLAVLTGVQGLPKPKGFATGTLDVTLLQGNIAQDEKFDATRGVPQALKWYGQQLQTSRSALIITPETALPLLPNQLPSAYWQSLQLRFAQGEQAALVGMPMGSFEAGYTNSVAGFKPGQSTLWRYDKHHLVPFGEFIPPWFRWFTNLMAIPLGDFTRGALPQPTFDWQGQRLGTSICFENLFGEELAAQFAAPERAPTILVNISNLGWFGAHLAMDQHLQIARARALEFDRPYLLTTNTGRTAVVDHQGRISAALPNHVAGALQAQVQGRGGITPYAWWVARWGQWPLAGLGAGVVVLLWWTRRQSKK